jgi:hypothetical protein
LVRALTHAACRLHLLQGYAFNTYGEVFACWVQDILLIALIFRFSGLPAWQAGAAGLAFAGLCR